MSRADCGGWPKIGRGCRLLPFKSGPSMVGELKVGNKWDTLAAVRLPRQLDDATKECHYQFFDAAQMRGPEEPFTPIPAPPRRRTRSKVATSMQRWEIREQSLHCAGPARAGAAEGEE
eukprot:3226691-Pyramimonas_sp.AAC.2